MTVRMVDVTAKPISLRKARAKGRIRLSKETLERILKGEIEKGDVISVAKTAAVLATKKTSDLIPLCHPLQITHVDVEIKPYEYGLEVEVEVTVVGKTGPDMEALTACSVALLTIFDMVKGYEKDEKGLYPWMKIESIELVGKEKRCLE